MTLRVLRLLVLAIPAAVGLPGPPALAQGTEGADLLAWMGLSPGDTMAFESSDGGRMCVTVGPSRRIGERAYASLDGLAWPGLPSDSRVLVPLDGTLGLFVDPTPGPRPSAEPLLDPAGWSRAGPEWAAADVLVYRFCEMCMDAGTTVVLEKDGGVRSIARKSIGGTTILTRLDGGCADRETGREGVELEIYVEPAPAREP